MKGGDVLVFKSNAPASATIGLEPEMEIVSMDKDGHTVNLVHRKADGGVTNISSNLATLTECCDIKSD